MQRVLLTLFALFLCFAMTLQDAEARRLGGGKSYGMQRQSLPRREATPNQARNPPSQAPATPAQPGKRSWMGPLAGLAAGIGLAALLSHFGLGGAVANFLLIALLVLAAFMLIGWVMRRGQPQPPRYASAGGDAPARFEPAQVPSGGASEYRNAPPALPADFDAEAFVRQAKVNFLRLQAANDAGNLDDLREFTSPEMYAEFKLDIDDRHGAAQRTEVVVLNAEVLDAVAEGNRQIVSVRFHGMLREDSEQAAAFDEIWHLTRPLDASHGWVVAGIQQNT